MAERLGYGELAEAAMAQPVPATVALKDPKDFRLIGRPTHRLDAAAKSGGRQDFGIDVRLLWRREDDVRGGYYRPMHRHRAHIGFDDSGKVLAWDHVLAGQSIATGTPFEAGMLKNGVDASAVEGMREPCPLPMRLTVHHPKLDVPVLWWRSVGATHTAFVMETLIDEIARQVEQDTVAYRMRVFDDEHPRHRAALQSAVDRSDYGKQRRPAEPRAWRCTNRPRPWSPTWWRRRQLRQLRQLRGSAHHRHAGDCAAHRAQRRRAHLARSLPTGRELMLGLHNLADTWPAEESALFTQAVAPRTWRLALRGAW